LNILGPFGCVSPPTYSNCRDHMIGQFANRNESDGGFFDIDGFRYKVSNK
jgi:hypothetical protein